jgi:hypothetical protein
MGAMLALVLLGTAPGARSPAAAQRATAAAPPARSQERSQEIRALWVLRGSLTRPDRIDRLVTAAARSGFNTLLIQVRGRGDAYYDSAIEPRGLGVAATFDPLAYAIAAAGKSGLRVHVWFNTNLVASTAMLPTSRTHVVNAHPEWLMVPRPIAADLAKLGPRDPRYLRRLVEWTRRNAEGVEGLYTSPVTPEAAQYLERVVSDIVTRYYHCVGRPSRRQVSVEPVRPQPGVAARLPRVDAARAPAGGSGASRRSAAPRSAGLRGRVPERWASFRRLRLAPISWPASAARSIAPGPTLSPPP